MGAAESKQLRRDFENLKRNDPTLRSLDYEKIHLGNEGATTLANALSSNTNLKKLHLGRCHIGPEGLHSLVRSLCEDRLVPSKLRKLELVSLELINWYNNFYNELHPLFVCSFLCCRVPAPPPLKATLWETRELEL